MFPEIKLPVIFQCVETRYMALDKATQHSFGKIECPNL